MEQKQNIQNKPNNDEREKQCCVSPAVTGIAIAVWIFIGLTALLWFVIGSNITDEAKRFEVGIVSMLNIAIVIIVVVHAVIYWKQTEAMIGQSEISRRQFEITDRPWLAVDVVLASPLTFNEQGGHLTFRFEVQNVGRSVAVNATVNAKIVIPKFEGDIFRTVMAEQLQVCQNINSAILSYAIFPERRSVQVMSFGIAPSDIEQGRIAKSDYLTMYIVGCVDYQFSGHKAHHQTRFNYQVLRKEGAVSVRENTPVENLFLQRMIIGGGDYAD